MSNHYFKFKQFTVYQDKCAMKVGTDGVLLGAWVGVSDVEAVLDAGTGTGLIALMINQRTGNKIDIDAIDIDENAVLQAKENMERNNIKNIIPIHKSLQDYAADCDKKYSLIVSNPPYFSSSLHSPDKRRTLARHTDTLPLKEFFRSAIALLAGGGRIAIIYPYSEKQLLADTVGEAGLHISRITNVYPTPGSAPKRVLMEFTEAIHETAVTDLVIELERHVYSLEFTAMMKDFYLKM